MVQTESIGNSVVDRCPADRLDELYALRARVWIAEGAEPSAFPGGRWRDAADATRLHWIGLVDGRVVAGGSLSLCSSIAEVHQSEAYAALRLPPNGLIAVPCRVVVDRAFRDRGFISRLLDAQDDAARSAGAVVALRQAAPKMRSLLQRRGWIDHGAAPADARFPGVQFSVMSLVLDDKLRILGA